MFKFFLKFMLFSFVLQSAHADSCQGKKIHLSFDDGPNLKTTKKILDALNRNKVKASFFVNTDLINTGQVSKKELQKSGYESSYRVNSQGNKKRRDLVKKYVSQGHRLGSHGYEHYSFLKNDPAYTATLDSDREQKENINFSKRVIREFVDEKTPFRLPYGKPFNSGSQKSKRKEVKQIMSGFFNYNLGWKSDSRDWEYEKKYTKAIRDKSLNKAEKIKKNFIKNTVDMLCSSAGVAVFHDNKKITADAIDQIIKQVKRRGGKFQTYEEALRDSSNKVAFETLNGNARRSVASSAISGESCYGEKKEFDFIGKFAKQNMEAIGEDYPIHVGSYKNKRNAEQVMSQRDEECLIIPFQKNSKELFHRVRCKEKGERQVGAFRNRSNAETMRAKEILSGSSCRIKEEKSLYKVMCR